MKLSKVLFLVLVLLYGGVSVGAYPTVKVKSSLCDTNEGLETSGVPVRFQGRTYILTSRWGVLEESQGVCHDIFSGGENFSASLSYFDWASGFALLEVKKELDVAFDFDSEKEAPSSTEVTIVGFSKGKEISHSPNARIVASKSTRHHFPSLATSLEVVTEKLDSGFIGSPVYGDKLRGIVSSQWIEIIPGSKARINEWSPKASDRAEHLIVIPLSLIQEKLAHLKNERRTFEPARSKLTDRNEFYLGKIHWKLFCPKLTSAPKDIIGPIGGPDGVGIGGSMKAEETCSVEVKLQEEMPLEPVPFMKESLLKDLNDSLLTYKRFSIPYLYDRDLAKHIVRMPFLSFAHFFKDLSVSQRLPVLVYPEPPKGNSTAHEQMRNESLKLKALLTDTYPLVSKREGDRKEYRSLYAHLLLLDSTYWKLSRDSDFFFSDVNKQDFAKNLEYKGEKLQVVLAKQLQIVQKLFRDAGGTL